jgi:HAD superfamily hydrolase (TIGR01509 family)
MIKAIIFDCFGVLVTDSLDAIINSNDLSEIQRDEIKSYVTAANKGSISVAEYRSEVANILNMEHKDLNSAIKNGEIKDENLLEYIRELKKEYKIGLLSNVTSLDSLKSRFAENELEDNFDVVVASGQIGYAKPEAEAYEITVDKLGVFLSECVMIDDREEYVNAAVGIGMKGIVYTGMNDLKKELKDILKP